MGKESEIPVKKLGYRPKLPTEPGFYYYVNLKKRKIWRVEVAKRGVRLIARPFWYPLNTFPGWYKKYEK